MPNPLTVSFPFSRLTPEQVKAFTQKVGRPPTPGEELMGQLARQQQPFFGDPWRVRMAAPSEDPLDREERLAQEQVEDERLGRMSPAERALNHVQKARAKRDADIKSQADHEAKLKVFKPHLEQLEKLLENARFDPDYTFEQVADLWNCKKQIEHQGSCPMYAQQLFAVALATAREKFTMRQEKAKLARDSAAAEQARLDQAIIDFKDLTGIGELTDEQELPKTASEAFAAWKSAEKQLYSGKTKHEIDQLQEHWFQLAQQERAEAAAAS